ncbi:M20/M25/M40 family metallo-hydrolase [Gracilimonas sediminicola]|uniref:M20/M25/M40 family metallo-hydrolase n=1 Tax=Gracilimonas sediminicola TaxID=2952158 RepID=A0A9X2L150_9BACT|nr:M20/M25/M40 family metallo-hydrolase [Gracilimonas sediminicola]MCP9290391.1 M20/M25/M40 family metallo-hydrolase [Gracilimonas sediminicola]
MDQIPALPVFFAIIFGFLISACTPQPQVTERNVSRIIETLSSDQMKGRHAFGNGIEKAADFISTEYQDIGLSTLPGNNNFRQEFSIYSLKPSQASVSINNRELGDQHYFGLTNAETVNWTADNSTIHYISAKDDYRDKFSEYSSDDESSVIIVDEEHEKLFHKYRTYFSRSNRTFELGSKPNDIFVFFDGRVNNYDITLQNTVKSQQLANVIGKIEGKRKNEIVLFSAHYDHIGVVSPVDEDSIANGANDNASGVSAVIELARYFQKMPTPERTLYFVAFTGEEVGGYGSKYFSRQMNPDEIVAMFNIEMIGKPDVDGANSAWITGFEKSTFGEILQNSVSDSNFVFYPDPYPNQNLFYRSDNATLARLGVPAHTISTTPIDVDQDYHRVSDEFSTLDIPHVTNTIRAIAKAARVIISAEKTPTRISNGDENLTSND